MVLKKGGGWRSAITSLHDYCAVTAGESEVVDAVELRGEVCGGE